MFYFRRSKAIGRFDVRRYGDFARYFPKGVLSGLYREAPPERSAEVY